MSQANYKDTRKILAEAVLVSFLLRLWACFCFLGYFQKQPFKRISKNLKAQEISRKYIAQFLHIKTVIFLFIVKAWSFKKRHTSKDLTLQKEPSVALRKIYSETPVPESLFNEDAGLHPGILLKKRLLHRCCHVGFERS